MTSERDFYIIKFTKYSLSPETSSLYKSIFFAFCFSLLLKYYDFVELILMFCYIFIIAMTKTITNTLLCCALLFTGNLYAQQPAYTYYTIRDGLPSNDIYNCIEDKKGFLWIATENGLSRFDGKNFKNYYSAQGLPDNDILSVELDSAGKIWIMPFQKSPAYYDEKTDRFINSTTDAELGKIPFGNINYVNALSGGGMIFCNSKGQFFIYKNNRCTSLKIGMESKFTQARAIEILQNKYLIVLEDSLRTVYNGKIIDKQLLNIKFKQSAFVNNQLYVTDSMRIVKIEILSNGKISNRIELKLPFEIRGLNFTGKQLAISSDNGNIYLADTATLAFSQQAFSINSLPRFVYEDNAGNTWICTKENGLIRYQQKGILSISDAIFQRNFNTVSFLKNQLVAGTNDGQVFIFKGPYDYKIIALNNKKNYASWIRKMVPTKDGIFIGAEGGLYFLSNFLNKMTTVYGVTKNLANKDIILLDDTTLITGNSGLVCRVHLPSLNMTDSIRMRVTALEASSSKNIYIGSNNGLFKWEGFKKLKTFGENFSLLNTRVSSLTYNKADDILWVGLATDSLVAMQNDVPISVIPLGAKLPGNTCRALYSKKKGLVWVGTNMAVARIEYRFKNNKLIYKIAVFTTADGIAGKQINDIKEREDTIYVATSSGISMIPASLHFNVLEIPVYVTKIKINNADTTLLNEYNLGYKQNNISINFSAADLAATTERIYEYRVNNEPWVTSQLENIALQQLAAGKYIVQIRAIKKEGSPSERMAEVSFIINAVFWKNPYFLAALFLISLTVVFYFTQKRNKRIREQTVQKILTEKKLADLELKALKAQINPHFVFNCLNSIKYLNHQKKFAETEIYLDKFSYLLRKTLDFSGFQKILLEDELEYSKNYLELEKLRLGNKLQYEIVIEKDIDIAKIFVPPMLFQPYLENAIKHGIRYLKHRKGLINIEIKKDGEAIVCSITDNGVGIVRANNLNIMVNPGHRSYGTTLQQRRAQLYNVSVQINSGVNDVGTLVTLTLYDQQVK